MMKWLFGLFLLIYNPVVFAQDNTIVFKWEELREIAHDPDTVYHISFRKEGLTALPNELFVYKNLKSLDISKNHIRELSDSLASLKQLRNINLERNKLDKFPLVFCRMMELRTINLGLNAIENIPICIEGIKHLENLLLYDNPISAIPEEISNLKELKYLDLSGIRFSPEFQKIWTDRLSHVRVDFDAPCDCMK
jgi:Leucine-rich repeat (LRR) protein